jgi:hypothetical protein
MESAIFGLIGVILGGVLTLAREWFFASRKNKKDAQFLAIQVSCALDRYVASCANVVGDDGLCEGRPDETGCRDCQVENPKIEMDSFNVEWKSLPSTLMYNVLDLPYQAELASQRVSNAFEYAYAPDYDDGFEERQYQYALLGIAAAKLASDLLTYAGLPLRTKTDRDPVSIMQGKLSSILETRADRERCAKAGTTDPLSLAL